MVKIVKLRFMPDCKQGDDYVFTPASTGGKDDYYKIEKVVLRGLAEEDAETSDFYSNFTNSESICVMNQPMAHSHLDMFKRQVMDHFRTRESNRSNADVFITDDDLSWLLGINVRKYHDHGISKQHSSEDEIVQQPQKILMLISWIDKKVSSYLKEGRLAEAQFIAYQASGIEKTITSLDAEKMMGIINQAEIEGKLRSIFQGGGKMPKSAEQMTQPQIEELVSGLSAKYKSLIPQVKAVFRQYADAPTEKMVKTIPDDVMMLIRIYSSYPDYIQEASVWHVQFENLVNLIKPHTHYSSYIGRLMGKSDGLASRWKSGQYMPKATTQRLIDVLYHHFSKFKGDPGKMRLEIEAWRNVVSKTLQASGKKNIFG